jgi:hypothetical protein
MRRQSHHELVTPSAISTMPASNAAPEIDPLTLIYTLLRGMSVRVSHRSVVTALTGGAWHTAQPRR